MGILPQKDPKTPSRPLRPSPGLSLWGATCLLAIGWALSLLYGEMAVFWLAAENCYWPNLNQEGSQSDKSTRPPFKVAMISDPQVLDRDWHSPISLVRKFQRLHSDVYMRRSFQFSVMHLEPDFVFILGDLLKNGANLDNSEWFDSLRRYGYIFDNRILLVDPLKRNNWVKSKMLEKTIYVNEVSGDQDVGFAETQFSHPEVLEKFSDNIGFKVTPDDDSGDVNYEVEIGATRFVILNTLAFGGFEKDTATSTAWNFSSRIAQEDGYPVVLLSHLPLHRTENSSCGVYSDPAEANEVTYKAGRITHQKYVTENFTAKLLQLLQPVHIFSGHLQNFCQMIHRVGTQKIPEITLGSFNPLFGLGRPHVLLMSVAQPGSSDDQNRTNLLTSAMCNLPSLRSIQLGYKFLAFLTIVILLLWPSKGLSIATWNSFTTKFWSALDHGTDMEMAENGDFEMIFDSEGAMHLVGKVKVGATLSEAVTTGTSSDRKGTAQARHLSKKTLKELEFGEQIEGASTKNLPKLTKSKPKRFLAAFLLRRILDMSGPVMVLLVVETALFIALVSKDWS